MSVFYRIACLIVIAICAGCNNSRTNKALILQERQNSQPLILATSRVFAKDYRPSLLVFSPDSQFILARDLDMGNHIYSLNRDEPPLIFNAEKYPELLGLIFRNAGFIDNNHIFLSGYQSPNSIISSAQNSDEFKVYIFQLPVPELVASQAYRYTPRYPVNVNHNYIAMDEYLTNWHSQQNWSVKIAFPVPSSYQLTSSGQVITYNWQSEWILLSDPINNNHYNWDSGINIYLLALSTSENYLIASSHKGDCVVWQLSDRSKVGHCGGGNWFSEMGKKVIVTNSLNDQFAFIRDNKITVYSLPSLENIFELTFEGEISDANFSGDLLVVKDDTGRTELWQVSSKKLLGIPPDIYPYLPTIQPNGEHLALIYDDQLQFFKIPNID